MAVCLVALAGCAEDAAPPIAGPSTTTPVVTTTTTTTTATVVDDEAAVRDAHLAYLAMFEVVGDPPDPDHPELALRATGDAYERLRASLLQDRAAGNRLVGGWQSSIRAIVIQGTQATVQDCLLDAMEIFSADGHVMIPADTERVLLTSRLEQTSSGWKVWRLEDPSPSVPCDP